MEQNWSAPLGVTELPNPTVIRQWLDSFCSTKTPPTLESSIMALANRKELKPPLSPLEPIINSNGCGADIFPALDLPPTLPTTQSSAEFQRLLSNMKKCFPDFHPHHHHSSNNKPPTNPRTVLLPSEQSSVSNASLPPPPNDEFKPSIKHSSPRVDEEITRSNEIPIKTEQDSPSEETDNGGGLKTEPRDSDSPSSVMKFFPFGLDQNMVCPLCKKCFRFEKNLLRHMQNSHATGSGESVLKCKLCHYTTRHYSNMYVHIRTHTGDKPYSCSACGAAFTQGSSLKLHIKSRHNDNTQYFSLTRKPGKNNLTKLWTRVLKKDLPKFNSNVLSAVMMSALSAGWHQQTPAPPHLTNNGMLWQQQSQQQHPHPRHKVRHSRAHKHSSLMHPSKARMKPHHADGSSNSTVEHQQPPPLNHNAKAIKSEEYEWEQQAKAFLGPVQEDLSAPLLPVHHQHNSSPFTPPAIMPPPAPGPPNLSSSALQSSRRLLDELRSLGYRIPSPSALLASMRGRKCILPPPSLTHADWSSVIGQLGHPPITSTHSHCPPKLILPGGGGEMYAADEESSPLAAEASLKMEGAD